jgi:gamma-glutamyl:cysteine ligase YbdK (ATP-grasp superfamily)
MPTIIVLDTFKHLTLCLLLLSLLRLYAFDTESRHLTANVTGNHPSFKTEGQKTKLRAQYTKIIESKGKLGNKTTG